MEMIKKSQVIELTKNLKMTSDELDVWFSQKVREMASDRMRYPDKNQSCTIGSVAAGVYRQLVSQWSYDENILRAMRELGVDRAWIVREVANMFDENGKPLPNAGKYDGTNLSAQPEPDTSIPIDTRYSYPPAYSVMSSAANGGVHAMKSLEKAGAKPRQWVEQRNSKMVIAHRRKALSEKATEGSFRAGDKVRFKDVKEKGDANWEGTVVENRGDRVLVRHKEGEGQRIQPTAVYPASDLVIRKANVNRYTRRSKRGALHNVRDHKRIDPSKRLSAKLMQVLSGMKYKEKKNMHDKIMGHIQEVKTKVLKGEGTVADVYGLVMLATDLVKARPHKYIKREGAPGKYSYTYQEETQAGGKAKELEIEWKPMLNKYGVRHVENSPMLLQLTKEAGLESRSTFTEEQYDKILDAAGKHGLSLVTVPGLGGILPPSNVRHPVSEGQAKLGRLKDALKDVDKRLSGPYSRERNFWESEKNRLRNEISKLASEEKIDMVGFANKLLGGPVREKQSEYGKIGPSNPKKFSFDITSAAEFEQKMKDISKDNNYAWTVSIVFGRVYVRRHDSPSKMSHLVVGDSPYTHPGYWRQGKLNPFSEKLIIEHQNTGIGGD